MMCKERLDLGSKRKIGKVRSTLVSIIYIKLLRAIYVVSTSKSVRENGHGTMRGGESNSKEQHFCRCEFLFFFDKKK